MHAASDHQLQRRPIAFGEALTTAVMRPQHAETLQALFSHPLQHNIRISDVEALLLHLNAQVEHLSDHRLKLQLTSGETIVLYAASGLHHAVLHQDDVMRLRRFLERAGINPEHPEPPERHARGDQAKRLVIHLDHRGARLWWLIGDEMETAMLEPHGLWSTHQRLTNRHDRDVAGQKAPLDYEYLHQLAEAVIEADRVLLLGHGHGQSDLRQLLTNYINQHHQELSKRLEVIPINDTAQSDRELLAIALNHFGNCREKP
jgi:hypothetical protein